MGHEAAHVLDVGLLESSDSQIWDYAIENGAAILTKDEDFAIRASVSKTPPLDCADPDRQLSQRKIAGVVRKRAAFCGRCA